ncbi:MAG TPA: HAD family hydrolase [Dehalococcoidales bacterium]|nr:HAD family hydrolase [Dehalococcoidales bacterium]
MIKAVFFDFYHTLVTYEPPQEELEAEALKELGVSVSPEVLRRPIMAADEFIYNEIARRPLSNRSQEEKMALYIKYQETVLREAGIKYDQKLVLGLLGKMQQTKMNLALFDDVAPALTDLKSRGIILGLISNVEQDMTETLTRLGLPSWLEIVVTSQDAGFNKPRPEIFQEALRQAGVPPSEAIYIGDQYQVDVIGANGAGMKGILIDRNDYYRDITDCLKISSLGEVVDYL